MDDKNKSALVFSMTGAVTGVICGSILKDVSYSNYLALLTAVGILYFTSRLIPLIGVNTERMGGRRKIIQGGFFSFLIWWLFWWFLIYNTA